MFVKTFQHFKPTESYQFENKRNENYFIKTFSVKKLRKIYSTQC